jgi:FkbM family methyltransferase
VIHALEPATDNFARLSRNLELNPGLDVGLHRVAVGDREGEVELISAPGGRDLAGTRVVTAEVGEEVAGGPVERAPMITLDGFAAGHGIERVDVLKLDVEGHELPALEGASALISDRRVGCVVCELNDVYLARRGLRRADVIAKFAAWGFRAASVPPVGAQRLRPARRHRTVEDVVFEPERDR